MNKTNNPFYDNHIFTEFDLNRVKIKWWEYPLLWFKPTYVQISDNYLYYYKLDGIGRIYLMKVEPWKNQGEG